MTDRTPTPNLVSLPTHGTLVFLFADVERSAELWERHPDRLPAVLEQLDRLVDGVLNEHGGVRVRPRGEGESLFAVFARPSRAIAAAIALQTAIQEERWDLPGPPALRVALHAGEAELRDGDYYGAAVNRCARIRSLAHGGQVLVSDAMRELLPDAVPSGYSLVDLGEHRLRDLTRPEHIHQLTGPLLPADFPPLRSLTAMPNNLPSQWTSFVGREREMREVRALLREARLLTITGTGGTGKTRLALQAAAEVMEAYPDGVWYVDLAAIAEPGLVPQAVAAVVGVREEPDRPLGETLADTLAGRRLLLLLDNCEHLLGDCAALASTLLTHCEGLQVLATSREALGIAGEQVYRLPALELPPVDLDVSQGAERWEELGRCEAVRLFVDRAASSAHFAFSRSNAGAVAQVCQRLDGIPLALELAAARVKAMPVEQLLGRLDDRFRLLTGGSRTALPRQQTLRALIDWSYDLLTDPERILLRRLSVFSGGWTLESAEAVCPDPGHRTIAGETVLDLLQSLVDKSLVLFEDQNGTERYRLLGTVRQYSLDRLRESGEEDDLRARHLAHYLALAEEADPQLRGPEPERWLACLEREHDNLRSALDWCHGGQERAPDGLRLVGALWRFWNVRGYFAEGREQISQALRDGENLRTSARARALNALGIFTMHQGDLDRAERHLRESLEIARELGDPVMSSAALGNLGLLCHERGHYSCAADLYEESLEIDRATGNMRAIGNTLVLQGDLALDQGELGVARSLYEQSLALRRQMGDKWATSRSLNNLGNVALRSGALGEARRFFEESLSICRQLGDRRSLCAPLHSLGTLALRSGAPTLALERYQECLAIARDLGLRPAVAAALQGIAGVAADQGDPGSAARFLGAAESVRRQVGHRLPPRQREEHDEAVAALRDRLPESCAQELLREGAVTPLDAIVAAALAYRCPSPTAGAD